MAQNWSFKRIHDHLIKTFGRPVDVHVRKGLMLKFNPDAHWSAAFMLG